MNAEYWIMFQQAFGCGTTRSGKVLQHGPSPREIFTLGARELEALGRFSGDELERIRTADAEAARRIVDFCDENGYAILTPEDPAYPERLREIYAPPAVLYCSGELPAVDDTLTVAVVGTRRATGYGVRAARELSAGLAENGVITVSGLAAGIDAVCHKATLDYGGRTIAVQGCGIDITYPPENKSLKREIIASGGAVVSEYPPGERPLAYHFPLRNRIISGLSNGTLVVEGTRRSGSLITAAHALAQGRDVFAVPGNIGQEMSEATNWLIRQGAALVTSSDDILEEYLALLPSPPKRFSQKHEAEPLPQPDTARQTELPIPPAFMNEAQRELYSLLGAQPKSCDELVSLSGMTVPQVLAAMTQLEILGFIKAYPGRLFGI